VSKDAPLSGTKGEGSECTEQERTRVEKGDEEKKEKVDRGPCAPAGEGSPKSRSKKGFTGNKGAAQKTGNKGQELGLKKNGSRKGKKNGVEKRRIDV